MSSGQGNIFLTLENLAFAMPLVVVCSSYAYFKYLPLEYGLPILGGLVGLYLIRAQFRAQRANKITNMDDKAISDLASELEGDVSDDKDEKAKKLQKKKNAIEHRLAAERKRDAKKKKKAKDDDDDDDAGLETFAKGSRVKKN